MLFDRSALELIRRGEQTVAYRRWKRPTVSEGGTLHTAIGVLRIDEVARVDTIEPADASAAGFDDVDQLLASLRSGDDRLLYRVRFHLESDDPRIELREQATITEAERTGIDGQLARWDAASRDGAWTRSLLGQIRDHPGARSADLAARLGTDQPRLKRRVRQLKRLGLTESLGTGYRLSPRGRSYHDA